MRSYLSRPPTAEPEPRGPREDAQPNRRRGPWAGAPGDTYSACPAVRLPGIAPFFPLSRVGHSWKRLSLEGVGSPFVSNVSLGKSPSFPRFPVRVCKLWTAASSFTKAEDEVS